MWHGPVPNRGRIIQSGQNWSQANLVGLGGVGNQVSLGELSLYDPTPQQATLTLGLKNLVPYSTLGKGRIYAVVSYGIGTASQTVVLDWCQGQSISLPAGNVTVAAYQVDAKGAPYLEMPAGYVVDDTETIDVAVLLTASLSAGPRSSLHAPTLTQTVNLAAGATVPWTVPYRAKGVMVGDQRGFLATDISAFVVGALAVNAYELGLVADAAIRTTGVELPGFTDNVQLRSGAGVNNVGLVWMLDG